MSIKERCIFILENSLSVTQATGKKLSCVNCLGHGFCVVSISLGIVIVLSQLPWACWLAALLQPVLGYLPR
jgi:hypothetical protein